MKKDCKLDLRVTADDMKALKRASEKASKQEKAIVTVSEIIRRFINGLK